MAADAIREVALEKVVNRKPARKLALAGRMTASQSKMRRKLYLASTFLALLFVPHFAFAQGDNIVNSPLALMVILAALSLAPFVLIMVTSFVKISVVLSMLRQALGTQQIPP